MKAIELKEKLKVIHEELDNMRENLQELNEKLKNISEENEYLKQRVLKSEGYLNTILRHLYPGVTWIDLEAAVKAVKEDYNISFWKWLKKKILP